MYAYKTYNKPSSDVQRGSYVPGCPARPSVYASAFLRVRYASTDNHVHDSITHGYLPVGLQMSPFQKQWKNPNQHKTTPSNEAPQTIE